MSAVDELRPAAPLPDPVGEPAGPHAADAADGTLVTVAADGVAVLVHWLVVLILLALAANFVLLPPERDLGVGAFAGIVCLVWATFVVGMGLMRGTRPDGADLPPPPWLSVTAAAGCMASLAIVRGSAGIPGLWSAEVVAAILLVASLAAWRGPVVGGVGGALLAGGAATLLMSSPTGSLLQTPVMGAVPGLVLLTAAVAVALALQVLLRSAAQLQQYLDDRADALVRERAVVAATEVAAELERSLHDTALNTLETVAAHGGHVPTEAVVERCRADAAQLAMWRSSAALADLDQVIRGLQEHALRLGLALDVVDLRHDPRAPRPPRLTPPVLRALSGAATEALTNVAKHARVDRARLVVDKVADGARLVVSDDGVGCPELRQEHPGRGFGLVDSVERRMAAAGGSTWVGTGPAGRGTQVVLEWQAQPERPPALVDDLLLRTASVGVLLGWLLAVASAAVVVLGWAAYSRPLVAFAEALLPAVVAGWIMAQARRGARIGASHVLAAASAYVMVGGSIPLADPYCSSLLGEGAALDARAAMLGVVLLLAPRASTVVWLAITVAATHVLGGLAWSARWPACGQDTLVSGVLVLAAIAALWAFVARIRRVSTQVELARAQATAAQVRIAAQLSVRTEDEAWVAETLEAATEVLGAIAEGRLDPADPDTRHRCAEESSFLRGLLAVGRAGPSLRRPARIWLWLLRGSGCRVAVRGSFRDCRPPGSLVGEIGGLIDTICALAPRSEVTIFAWAHDDRAGLTVTARSASIAMGGGRVPDRLTRLAPRAWHDVSGDTATSHWEWVGSGGPTQHEGG